MAFNSNNQPTAVTRVASGNTLYEIAYCSPLEFMKEYEKVPSTMSRIRSFMHKYQDFINAPKLWSDESIDGYRTAGRNYDQDVLTFFDRAEKEGSQVATRRAYRVWMKPYFIRNGMLIKDVTWKTINRNLKTSDPDITKMPNLREIWMILRYLQIEFQCFYNTLATTGARFEEIHGLPFGALTKQRTQYGDRYMINLDAKRTKVRRARPCFLQQKGQF